MSAVPDAPTFAAFCTVTPLPAAIVRFAAGPSPTAPVASSITPAFTTAPSTSMSPSLDASATPSLPETSVLSPVPFAAVASPDTYTATDFSAVTAAPFCAVNEPERLPSASSPTSTSPFAATVAASTVTAPVASMSTSPAARTFAPVCAVTDAPSRVTSASEPIFAPFCARIAPVVFTVRSSFATSCEPVASAASPTTRLAVPSAPVLFMPTATVELPPTNEPPLIVTAPASASTVIAPLATSCEPDTVTPSAFASMSAVPDAPTFAPFSTVTLFPAVIARFAESPSAITGALPSVGISNAPAFTTAPGAVSEPMVISPSVAVSITPVSPTTAPSTSTFVLALSSAVVPAATAVLTLIPDSVDSSSTLVPALTPPTCVLSFSWSISVLSAVSSGHSTSVTLRSSPSAIAESTVSLPLADTLTYPSAS